MSAMPTLRAHTLLVGGADRPPVILVHGAANSGHVWTFWQDELACHGWSSHAIDLRGHGTSAAADLAITRMADYADDVIAYARTLRQAPVLVGWSMGGLVALMASMSARLASSSPPPRARCWSSLARPTRSGPGRGTTIFRSRPITSRLTAPRIGDWF
jgi:pimeloyl-ACP methyl ester carboxylesterase